jgi:hypothetical protein
METLEEKIRERPEECSIIGFQDELHVDSSDDDKTSSPEPGAAGRRLSSRVLLVGAQSAWSRRAGAC